MDLPLTAEIRARMRKEVELDRNANKIYTSPRLTGLGRTRFPELLIEAAERGTTSSFSFSLAHTGILNENETSNRNGKTYSRKVPSNAHITLAEGELNRFYIRAVCLLAIEQGRPHVVVFRAKPVDGPRPESQALIGTRVDPKKLLEDLRNNIGVDAAPGIPGGPNSGPSVRLD